MTSAPDLSIDRGQFIAARGVGRAALANCLGQCDEIIDAARWRSELAVMPDDFPAARCGKSECVLLTEVVRVRFGECRQGADNCRRVRIDIGQRCDRQTWQPLREQRRGDLTAARYRRWRPSGRHDTPEFNLDP